MKRILLLSLLALAPAFALPASAQHDAQLTATLASTCTTTKPCNANFYRAAVASSTAQCPTALTAYTAIAANVPGTTVTASGTTTVYDDQDAILQSGASYCYTVTDLYVSGGGESAMGPITLVTFPAPAGPPTSLGAVVKK